MELLYIYSCLQIIFESLPVSSSGNLRLWIPVVQNYFNCEQIPALIDFDFLLHVPTFFIVTLVIILELQLTFSNCSTYKSALVRVGLKIALIDLITALFYGWWRYFIPPFFPLWLGFLCTTAALFSLCFAPKGSNDKTLSWKDALCLGLVQGCALLPGISRFGSTLVAGIWLGLPWVRACIFALLIELPLIGVGFLKIIYSSFYNPSYFNFCTPTYLSLIIAASLVSFCLLRTVFDMVKKKTVWKFGWYTLFLAILAKVWGG